MTRLTADQKCTACGGMLVPPSMAFDVIVPADAQYVCYICHRPYRWVGDPPQLAMLVAVEKRKKKD